MSRRAEYRRPAKQKVATFNMTSASLEETLAEAARREKERITPLIVHQMNVATAFAAHDKLGFGPVRLQRFLSDIMQLYDSIDKGYLAVSDMERALLDETGVEVK